MTDEIRNAILIEAENWLNRTGRTSEEKEAYLAGVEDALFAVYQNTRHGAYPANTTRSALDDLFYL